MSKIERIYQGLNEIQKYYQDGVLQKLFFDWKHYIGTELNIEYGKECAGRNVVINGKTYQNLVINLDELVGNVYTRDTVAIIDTSLFKANTTYTAIITISESNYSYEKYGAIFSIFYPTLTNGYVSISLKDGTFKLKFTTKEETPSKIQVGVQYGNSASSSFKLNNLIVLEGDYTSIDLPDNINEIESIGEREIEDNNLISEMIVGWCNIATGNLEGCPESYPNSKVSNLIEINPNIKYKSNILSRAIGETTGTDNLRIRCFDENKNYIKVAENTYLCDFNDFYNHKDIYIKTKYIRILVLNSSLEVEEPYLVKENINRFNYPVTIRNYNYQCETDNTILPNGIKNSIDTIDGKKVHTRRVGAVLLNGTQDMTLTNVNQTLTTRVRIRMDNAKVSKNNLLCNWFIRTGVHGDYEYIIIQDSSEGICLFISVLNTKLSAPTADGVKQYFSENPLWVFYELATPLYNPLESGLYDDITLPSSNIKNEIYLENGKWYHKRNIGKVIFDGSDDEEWYKESIDSVTRFYIKLQDSKYSSNRSPVYVDGYKYISTSGIQEDKQAFLSGAISGTSKFNYLYIYNFDYTNLESGGFKAYLAENPHEVYYELAEPVITELPCNDITYKLNEPLRSLPNGTCDTIEGNKPVQRVGIRTFDGSEDWKLQSINYNENGLLNVYCSIKDLIVKTSEKQSLICNKYISQKTAIANTTTEGVFVNEEKRLYLRLFTSKATTVEEAKEYIKDNPFVVYYELATPIETEITPDMILINGETITDTIGTELPNEVKDSIEEGYYIKRVGKVTYNGQEDWKTAQASTNVLVFYLNNTNFKELSSLICDTYTVSATSKDKTITCGNAWRPQIRDDSCSTVEEFKQLLAKNPITVWYELATPVKIPLFSIKEGLNTLKSTNNITPQLELDCLVRDDFQNLCDNIWESGDINLGGVNYDNINRIRLVNYIELKPNTIYRLDITNSVPILNSGIIGTRFYDSSKKYLGNDLAGNIKSPTYTFTTPADCYYIRFIAETRDTNFKIYLKEVIE